MPSQAHNSSRSTSRPVRGRAQAVRARQVARPDAVKPQAHVFFYPLVALALLVWIFYRTQMHFTVWFDEIIGKAVFFGLPVWLYVSITGYRAIADTFALEKLKKGLLLGLAFGGIFGFTATLISAVRPQIQIQSAELFAADIFWWEFLLAIFTGFWETVFFYSFVMTVIEEKYAKWSLLQQILLTAAIFLVFHLPNMFIRFSVADLPFQVLLITFFAIGQAFLFAHRHNGYALTLSHALWGMVLFVHLR